MFTLVTQTLIYNRTICSIVKAQPRKVIIQKWNGGALIEVKVKDITFDKDCHIWRATTGKQLTNGKIPLSYKKFEQVHSSGSYQFSERT